MNKILRVGTTNLIVIPKKPKATIESVYGIGRQKAYKVLHLLLLSPRTKTFKKSLSLISQELFVQRIFKAIKSDNPLKLLVYENLEKKARIGCYKAHRILQNLPSGGQRTHTNAGTPSRLNPFVALGVKNNLTEELRFNNKKWELNWNGRSSDHLMDFSGLNKNKYSRKASLEKKKKKLEKERQKKIKALKKKNK